MTISRDQLSEILSTAESHVYFLGVVPFDANWELLADKWCSKLKDNPNFKITILCESDNMLFSKSLISDTDLAYKRINFQELKFIRDRTFDLKDSLLAAGTSEDVFDEKDPLVEIEIIHLNIPVSIIQVDGRIFANMWLHELSPKFEEVKKDHQWRSQLNSYIQTFFSKDIGRKYSCKAEDESLELFDHDRIPRGIYPRKSFYDTDYSQLVVWAFIFDRKGRLLIHKRKKNAKDNQEMWDKSVGGHVDFDADFDTSQAVLREVVEELFSEEMKKSKVDLTTWAVSNEDLIYLGDWRPNRRQKYPFYELNHIRREWAFFKASDSPRISSPRTLPDGGIRRLQVIADVFLFVTGPAFNDESLGVLENSKFKLIELSELKNVMDKTLRNEKVKNFDTKQNPQFTPDLTNVMTGKLRDTLEEFSQYIKKYIGTEE